MKTTAYTDTGPTSRGAFRGRAHQTKTVPPKRGLCPKEINWLKASGVQTEALDSQIAAYRPTISDQELFFCNFCGLTPNFMKRWDEDLFFGLHRFRLIHTLEFT